MLCRFMRNAHPVYQAEAIDFAGRILEENDDLPGEVVERLKSFFEWWEKELSREAPKGWKAFGDWFVSPYLDPAWKIEKLVTASQHSAFSYRSDEVLKNLAENYFEEYPEQVLTVTENYIGHQLKRDQRWALDSRDALPEILRLAHHHGDNAIRSKADELLGRLVSEGFMKYREIAEE